MFEAYSSRLYPLSRFGSTVLVPEWLCSLRYRGTSLAKARASILPLSPGCSGIIKRNRTVVENYYVPPAKEA
jgi:hypothetical protein